MKKTLLYSFMLSLFLFLPVQAQIQEGIGASSAQIDSSLMVNEVPIKKPSFFTISTLKKDGTTSPQFNKGEFITFSFYDVVSFNVICNKATFVMSQFDSQKKFLASWRSGTWDIRGGNRAYDGIVTKVADKTGQFTVVGFLWCLDPDWKQKNEELTSPVISQGQEQHRATYTVVEENTCLPDAILSNPYCADGNVIRNVREGCEQRYQLVTDCVQGEQYCSVDSCIGVGSGSGAPGEEVPPGEKVPVSGQNSSTVPEGGESDKFVIPEIFTNPLFYVLIGLSIVFLFVLWRIFK